MNSIRKYFRPITLIILTSFFIRLSYALYSFKNDAPSRLKDDIVYYNYGLKILKYGPFIVNQDYFEDPTELVIGPGLPWILSIILSIHKSWLIIFIINALVGSITNVIIYCIALHIYNKEIALISGIWASFYILYLKYIPTAGKEIWICFLFLLTMLLLIKSSDKKNYQKKTIFLAIVFVFLIHIDERYFVYSIIIIGYSLLCNKEKIQNRIKKALLFITVMTIFMIPWLIRNYIIFNKIVILTPRTTVISDKLLGYKSNTYSNNILLNRWQLTPTEIDSVIAGKMNIFPFDGRKIPKDQIEAMKNGNLPHQFSFVESYWSIFKILWKPIDLNEGYSTLGYRFDGKWSLLHNLSVGFTYGILLPFALFGLIITFNKKRKIDLLFISIFLLQTLIHILFIPYTRNRYRIPIDGLIIIIGISGIYFCYQLIKNKLQKPDIYLSVSDLIENIF